jgi:hypothetical protein
MALLTETLHQRLLQQGEQQRARQAQGEDEDLPPVVKLFTPDGAATWLLSELDPDDPDLAFGLCDLGLGFPELGYVRLSELEALRGGLGLPVERDRHFRGTEPLSAYLAAALAGVN